MSGRFAPPCWLSDLWGCGGFHSSTSTKGAPLCVTPTPSTEVKPVNKGNTAPNLIQHRPNHPHQKTQGSTAPISKKQKD